MRSCGCVVLYRSRLSLVGPWSDADGRFVQCEFSFRAKLFRVACIYALNRNPARDNFFSDVEVRVDPSVPTLLCGDFNVAFDRLLDRAGSDPFDTVRERSVALSRLFSSCCVLDIWRYLHPSSNSFTWSRWNGVIFSRIDLFGVPFSWVSSVAACDILPFPFSDHCAVYLSVSFHDAITSGPRLWKLNLYVLDNREYVSLITGFWSFWLTRIFSFSFLDSWWDEGKREIRRLSMDYCKRRAAAKRVERDLLTRLADFLNQCIDAGAMFCFGPYQTVLPI